MSLPFERFGGRRFLLVCAVYLVSTALLWFGKLPADVYGSILQWSVAAYIAGNVAQRHVESRSSA
jgi:hypothetical protein